MLDSPRARFGASLTVRILALSMTCAGGATAQSLPLKRPVLPPSGPLECPTIVVGPRNARVEAAVMDSLLAEGSRAAILGDQEAARSLLQEAVRLDPRNSVASYRLARTLDERGENEAALIEYCRYLALAPTALEGAEIRGRLQELAASGVHVADNPWASSISAGITAFDEGRFGDAVSAFTRAGELLPSSPETYYNRAIAYEAAGNRADAARDLESYLTLAPDASDATEVRNRMTELRTANAAVGGARPPVVLTIQPGDAFLRGLLVPGLGQFSTRRPALGMTVLAAVGGAVFLGLQEETVTRTRSGVDPFGNPYPYEVSVVERPNQTLAIIGAVGISAAAALESFLYTRRAHEQLRMGARRAPTMMATGSPFLFSLSPTNERFHLGIRVPTRSRPDSDP